ncbi:MAG: serine/threonine protein kinase, partial [Planctomycetales bacterium]|nr:serine/threonine protein kinase [Planctomycetales bacterium]
MAQPNDRAVPDESSDGDHLTASSGSESAYDATLHYDLSDSPEPGTAAGVSFEARLGDTSQPAVDSDQTIETSSSATSNPSESPAPQVAGRYVLQGEIARGGMGAIFSARDEVLGRDLAIKVLLDSHVDSPETGRRFIEEAQINGQLQHPGIVPVHELGTLEDRRPFFAMKLVKGQTLKALLAERPDPRSDLSRFLGVFEHICLTMAYAHDRGVIHRDLKPANVMVGAFGEVQVMDWGLAKVITGGTKPAEEPTVSDELSVIRTIRNSGSGASSGSESHTQFGWAIGTPAYMPPEQALGEVERMDERADVFGLGAILCEILTGTPPYVNDQRRDIMRMAMRGETTECFARLDNSGAEQPLIDLAKECLAFDIAARPRNAK